MKNARGEWVCDFCDKNQKELKLIIVRNESSVSPTICANCVAECVQIIIENYRPYDE